MVKARLFASVVTLALLLLSVGPASNRDGTALQAQPGMQVVSPDDDHQGHDHSHTDSQGTLGTASTQAACEEDINRTGRIYNLRFVAAVDNGHCSNSDIDVYQMGARSYVIQGGWDGVAYTHYDVTNPTRPVIVRKHRWSSAGAPYTRTMSSKTFKRGSRYYVVVALERSSTAGYCGVVILDVTSPASPVKKSQYIGRNWCDTHNVFVEKDSYGNGAYIYATANYTKDLRVLDISGKHGGTVSAPKEIGGYRAPTADPYGPGFGNNWVHDITVVNHGGTKGRRVYVAYWYSGVVVLNAIKLTPGYNPAPLVGPNIIDSSGFRAHHAVANPAGTRLFVQDEFLLSSTARPVQMWNIAGVPGTRPSYVDGLRQNVGVNGRLTQAHNLLLVGTTLYVGWYTAGLQAFTFTNDGFVQRSRYHQVQTETSDSGWTGTWGVDTLVIGGKRHYFQADMSYGLIISKLP